MLHLVWWCSVGSNPWFNIPHLATDDYILRYANLTKQLLRPDVDIYVEYSNEVWGTLFPGGIYAQQQGRPTALLALSRPTPPPLHNTGVVFS